MWLLSAQTSAIVMGTEFVILVGLSSNSHVWLMAAMLDNTALALTTKLQDISNRGTCENKAEGQTILFLQLNTARGKKMDGGETYRLKQVKVTCQPTTICGSGI